MLRIDRLVQLADGRWWVLDYKLGSRAAARAPEYLAQLRAIAPRSPPQPGAEVRGAFITGDGG